MSVVLLLFGVNKIADLQTYLLKTLKLLALEVGIREYRLPLKVVFLAVVGAMALLALVALGRWGRNSTPKSRWLACGVGCLMCYYLLRAGGSVTRHMSLIGPESIWPLEVLGILLVLTAATLHYGSLSRSGTSYG
ncbi:hypothetical protein [Roseimaritima multifibrata]|uniref:hypothetical protein n=1 Tax=Roseimaritima multifibrata TaxID=1930274 RepID=UPI0011A11811|nr:hypothetical protein [Roseimaritima multifibrata]